MNQPIPADLDQLMWLLAESDDQSAMIEFGKRFPDLSAELNRRCIAVRGLRGAKPHVVPRVNTPNFQPRPSPVQAKSPHLVWALVGSLLVTFAFGSYIVTTQVVNKSTPKVEQQGGPTGPPLAQQQGMGQQQTQNSPEEEPRSLPPGSVLPIQDQRPKYLTPQSVILEEQPLQSAIQAIAQQTGMFVEVAPRTPNPTVSVNFENITGPQMLEQLGRAYGFSALNQGGNRYLVIPSLSWMDEANPSTQGEPNGSPPNSSENRDPMTPKEAKSGPAISGPIGNTQPR
jgi:hypothetical protein